MTRIAAGPLDVSYSSYDHTGNPLAMGDVRPGYGQSFGYDALDRLETAVGPYGSSTFSYDLHGNRSGGGYQYYPGTNRLSSYNGVGFTYDDNGNTVTAGASTFTYTPQNQLHTATGSGGDVLYSYDADEQRVRKAVSDSTSYFMRGPGGELLTEWKDPGTEQQDIRDYVYLGPRLVASASRPTPFAGSGTVVPSSRSHRYAASWQVPSGSGGNAVLTSGVSAAARKSSHPDMPATGLRIGVQALGTVDTYTPGPAFPTTGALPRQAGVFLEFEVERYPFTSDAEWLVTDGGGAGSSATDDLRLYLTAGGSLVLKHDGARSTPQILWTSPTVGLRTPHTLEIRFEHNVNGTHPAPNPVWDDLTSWVRVYFDGAPVASYGASEGGVWQSSETSVFGLDVAAGTTGLSSVKLKSPGSANGLLLNVWRVGHIAESSHGAALDQYGTTWRTTLLESTAQGSHAEWTGGQPDWRARAAGGGAGGFMNPVTTNVAGKKVSYLMESMLSRGITGKIGTVLVGVRMGTTVSTNSRAFVRRNGVETILSNLVLESGKFKWFRVAQSGWLATDTVEVGVTCGDNVTNSLHAVALLVEHNTPEPAPLTDSTVRVLTVNYTGNGGAQTVDLGLDQRPTALFVLPAQGVDGINVKPLWWWDSRLGAGAFTEAIASFGRVWPRRGKFHVLHAASGDSYNINGVPYLAIALFDPAARYVLPFAVSKASAEDNYTHLLRHPQTGALASTFTPDFVFGGAAFHATNDTVRASLYRGPGHAGDLTATVGLAQAAAADRIQAVGAGTVEFGTAIGQHGGDMAFWAGRVSDGVSTDRLMAVASYVGTGTAARTVGLALGGQTPVFVLVVPTSDAARIYRVGGDSTGRSTTTGSAVANSVTGLGADQISVGTALNATGVTYDVWAITTGVIAPQ